MTKAPELVRHLARKRSGTHAARVHLLSGRAARASIYPQELVEAVVQGLRAQREADLRAGRAACPMGREIEQDDEYTGEPLDEALVYKARYEVANDGAPEPQKCPRHEKT